MSCVPRIIELYDERLSGGGCLGSYENIDGGRGPSRKELSVIV